MSSANVRRKWLQPKRTRWAGEPFRSFLTRSRAAIPKYCNSVATSRANSRFTVDASMYLPVNVPSPEM